jgi:hypothetical protein
MKTNLDLGLTNLLQGAINLKRGQRVLLVQENPKYGWYDSELPKALRAFAVDQLGAVNEEDEVVSWVNDRRYGLAAGIWTQSIARTNRLVKKIISGTVYVNTYRAVSVYSPVGSYRANGFGCENGIESIRVLMKTKSVWIGTSET